MCVYMIYVYMYILHITLNAPDVGVSYIPLFTYVYI